MVGILDPMFWTKLVAGQGRAKSASDLRDGSFEAAYDAAARLFEVSGISRKPNMLVQVSGLT